MNVVEGSIWGIFRQKEAGRKGQVDDVLQAGSSLVAAGYAIYGPCTMIVITTGEGVCGFTLDPTIGEFVVTHPDIKIPERGQIYSVNEGNSAYWEPGIANYIRAVKDPNSPYAKPTSRYSGAMVGDVHRLLLHGGIFLYPGDKKYPHGKLRLLYEAAPMAFLCEQAGGRAIAGKGRRLLDIHPSSIHERSPVILGSPQDVTDCESFL